MQLLVLSCLSLLLSVNVGSMVAQIVRIPMHPGKSLKVLEFLPLNFKAMDSPGKLF